MISYHNLSVLYVSNAADASDDNTGLTPVSMPDGNGPFRTIPKALERVEELRRVGVLQPVSIQLVGGEYCLEETLSINERVCDVTIEPYAGQRVVLCGGRRITGFAPAFFNGQECFAAHIPAVEDGSWSFTDLYVDGLRADFTRYPTEGYLYPEDVEDRREELQRGSKWFIAKEGDIPSFRNVEDCFISFCHYWVDEHTPIESYDPQNRRVTFAYKSRYTIAGEKGSSSALEYYMENVAEQFLHPNEWYLDRPSGMLYYIPRSPQQTAESIQVYAPILSQFFSIAGRTQSNQQVRGIRLRNLEFHCTRGDYASVQSVGGVPGEPMASDGQGVSNADGAIRFENAHGCSMEGCVVRNYGLHGAVVGKGCSLVSITGSSFYDGGAGGIRISGGSAEEDPVSHTRGIQVSDCSISHCGRRYMSACGILITHGMECTISHNNISDLYYTGISCGWVWGYKDSVSRDNRIEKNHIWNLGQGVLSDMGGVYLLGKQPGTVVSGNLIHDIKSRHYGGWALYTDEGSSYMTLENNVCYNTSNNCYHQHYGSMNRVCNNIFAFSEGAMMCVTRAEMHLSIIFERNIVYADGSQIFDLKKEHFAANTVGSANNLYFDRQNPSPVFFRLDGAKKSLEDAQGYGMEYGSLVADPLFRAPERYDFTLLEGSPANKIGFQSIDLSDVGVRNQ